MTKRISIHKKGEILQLSAGVCKIDLLGGWGVKLGDFNITLINLETQNRINAQRTFFRLQSWEFSKRAKRVFIIDIINPGKYELEFQNSDQVEVRFSNLFLLSLIKKKLPNKQLEISIRN